MGTLIVGIITFLFFLALLGGDISGLSSAISLIIVFGVGIYLKWFK